MAKKRKKAAKKKSQQKWHLGRKRTRSKKRSDRKKGTGHTGFAFR
jgi:hypothetical protein